MNIKLLTNRENRVFLDWDIDDRSFIQPKGYRTKKPQYRLLLRLQVKNTSNRVIHSPRFSIDGKPPDRIESLISAGDKPTQRQKALRLYRHWTDNIVHYPVGIKACRHPFLLNNYWGYNVCGFAAAFLSTILQKVGIPARKVPVQGHVVHQYEIDDRWMILDADLNCVFRMRDNRRFAGFDDILNDPFLVHRTNTYGRHRSFDLERNRFCASLYDRNYTPTEKPPSYECDVFERLSASVTLYPGESIQYRFGDTVEEPLRESSSPHPKELGEASLMAVQYHFIPQNRPADDHGEKTLYTRYPIFCIRFSETGREVRVPSDRIVTHVTIPSNVVEKITCDCQCSRIAAPRLMRGTNTIRLNSLDSDIEAELTFELDSNVAAMKPPPPPELSVKGVYRDEPVRFGWNPGEAQTIWIQVFGEDEQPLLDYVRGAEETIGFHPVEQTFFDNDGQYRVRAKQQIDDIYSDWSDDIAFKVKKPATPGNIRIWADENGAIVASWEGEVGCEYLVFGSNRVDFVPDIYSDREPVSGMDGNLETERVSNMITSTCDTDARLILPCVYYRIVARRNGFHSNPSVLVDFSRNREWREQFNLTPRVLSTRHEMVGETNRYRSAIQPIE